MAPLYEVVMMTKYLPRGGSPRVTELLKSCAQLLWERGAVISDIQPWGTRELAYRIRKQGVNYYKAQYLSMQVYCSPPTLHELERKLNMDDHVLRSMSLKRRSVPALDREARFPLHVRRPEDPADLDPDPVESAKWEYRNLVMQRVFEGRTKSEIVSEHLTRHRFQEQQRAAQARPAAAAASAAGSDRGPYITSIRPVDVEQAAVADSADAPPALEGRPADASLPDKE